VYVIKAQYVLYELLTDFLIVIYTNVGASNDNVTRENYCRVFKFHVWCLLSLLDNFVAAESMRRINW